MANHKSASKRNRQRITCTIRHRGTRTRVRTAMKNARSAIAEGADNAAELVVRAQSLLDRAASKNAIPAKRAARYKSRLALALNRGPEE